MTATLNRRHIIAAALATAGSQAAWPLTPARDERRIPIG